MRCVRGYRKRGVKKCPPNTEHNILGQPGCCKKVVTTKYPNNTPNRKRRAMIAYGSPQTAKKIGQHIQETVNGGVNGGCRFKKVYPAGTNFKTELKLNRVMSNLVWSRVSPYSFVMTDHGYRYMVHESECGVKTLAQYFENGPLDLKVMNRLLLQIMYHLRMMEILKISHHDMHLNNIFVVRSKHHRVLEYVNRNGQSKKYYQPPGLEVRIFDYDLGAKSKTAYGPAIPNPRLRSPLEKAIGRSNRFVPSKDLAKVMIHLTSLYPEGQDPLVVIDFASRWTNPQFHPQSGLMLKGSAPSIDSLMHHFKTTKRKVTHSHRFI